MRDVDNLSIPLGGGAGEKLPVSIRTRPAPADPTSMATLYDEAIALAIALRSITLAFGPLHGVHDRAHSPSWGTDLVVGFEHEADGRRFLDMKRERLAKFALTLHPEKTRLITFGRLAAAQRAKLGLGKPETFNFLGFTHICRRTRQGRFQIRRKSRRDRRSAKLREIKDELRRRILQSIPEQGRWLKLVITGYYAYHAVRTNFRSLGVFRDHVVRLWGRTLRRRSQKHASTWKRIGKVADDWLPQPRVLHPWAEHSLCRQTPDVRAGCGKPARPDLCGGCPVTDVPTANAPAHRSTSREGLDFDESTTVDRTQKPAARQFYSKL